MVISGKLPWLPDELEDCDEAGQTHSGKQNDKDAADVGQAQLVGLAHAVVVLLQFPDVDNFLIKVFTLPWSVTAEIIILGVARSRLFLRVADFQKRVVKLWQKIGLLSQGELQLTVVSCMET